MTHVDLEAAKTAQEILTRIERSEKAAKSAEDLITQTLEVVQEDGPYAGTLFLCSKLSDKDPTPSLVRDNLLELAKTIGVRNLVLGGDVEKVLDTVIKQICSDLHTMLLVKQTWEQALIYARHSAKSLKAQLSGVGS